MTCSSMVFLVVVDFKSVTTLSNDPDLTLFVDMKENVG